MSSARTVVLSTFVLALWLGIFTGNARCQSLSTASRGAQFTVFAGYMPTETDYGKSTLNGYGAGLDFTIYPRFFLKPSIEVRGDLANNGLVTEKDVLVGPRLQMDVRNRLHPYGEFLIGGGELEYHISPYPDYTGDRSRVLAYGGGIDIDVTRNFGAKFEFQQRSWNLGSNPGVTPAGTYTLSPRMAMVGVTYTIPFRKLNRQGDFR
jgi:opacity protein-like surface antigen